MAIESDMERSVEEGEVWRSPSNKTQGSTDFDSWTVYSKTSNIMDLLKSGKVFDRPKHTLPSLLEVYQMPITDTSVFEIRSGGPFHVQISIDFVTV